MGFRFGAVRSASATRSAKRSRTSWRLRCWLRWVWDASWRTPSLSMREASLESMSWRRRSESEGDSRTFQKSWIRVALVLACCPPGPPDRDARSSSSASGMARRLLIRMMLGWVMALVT